MTRKTGVNVNEVLPPELLKQVKDEKCIGGLKIMVRLRIQLKWDYYLLKTEVLNIY